MRTTLKYLLASLFALLAANASAQDVQTLSFQNGTDGYEGTFDRLVSSRGRDANGADSGSYFLDGFSTSGSGSPDEQALIRFDDIFGSGEGQIPTGATILDARLTVTTSLSSNAQTSGPYGVAALLEPFDDATVYLDYFPSDDFDGDSRGPWWEDNSATRPVAGYGFQLPGFSDTADITSIVEAWSQGDLENHGLVLQAGRAEFAEDSANTSDGWSIRTTGFPFASSRPLLEVDYTTAPVVKSSFQDGMDGYEGTTMAIVRSGTNPLFEDTNDVLNAERTEDGFDFDQTFLDGVFFADTDGNTDGSPDDLALLRFDNVFGTDAGQAPADVPVAKAWAVITTGTDTNSRTSGPWTAHAMLRDWDLESLHSSFGDINGLQPEDGDISEALDTVDGFVRGSQVWFDVTDQLETARTGENLGIAIQTKQTADGWEIITNGSLDEELRPRLVVYSADLTVEGANPLDCNGDGVADGMDLACVHTLGDSIAGRDQLLGTISSLPGDFDLDGSVGFADFLILSANFGQSNDDAPAYTAGNIDMVDGVNFSDFLALSANFGQAAAAASVPEPSSGVLAGIVVVALGLVRRRRTAN